MLCCCIAHVCNYVMYRFQTEAYQQQTHIGMSIDTFRYFAGWCDKIQVRVLRECPLHTMHACICHTYTCHTYSRSDIPMYVYAYMYIYFHKRLLIYHSTYLNTSYMHPSVLFIHTHENIHISPERHTSIMSFLEYGWT